jgi:hypothetical protein
MGCSLIFRRAVLVEVAPSLNTNCQVVVAYGGGQITVHRYDPRSHRAESSQVVGSIPLSLHNRHYYHVVTPNQSYYFYVDLQGNVLEFDNQEYFDLARMRHDPSLGDGHEPVVGVVKPDPQRPSRFDRILRENEIWEEYHPPPRPIPELKNKSGVTEEELAAIFNKPQRLISQAPNPMDIDIIKCMEEVIGKTR